MNKFVFIKHRDEDNVYDTSTVTMEVNTICLKELQEEFRNFLLACGFEVEEES